MRKRYIIIVLDILLAAYVVFAMTSFNEPKELYPVCTQVNINIEDQSTFGFLNAGEIKHILQKRHLYPLNQRMKDVEPRVIEEMLRNTPFVKTAECFKTKDGHVQISLTQRSPILRIKNSRGEDYYIDENGGVMPKSNYTSDLIIATGNIDRTFAERYLSVLTNTIMASKLWSNQIEQINILDDHGVELVPRVGDHIVFLGYLPESKSREQRAIEIPEFVNKQFDRLDKFYRLGLSKAGWNRYERIDLQFVNQIICRKKGAEMARIEAERLAREAEEHEHEQEAAKQQQARAEAAGLAKPQQTTEEPKKPKASAEPKKAASQAKKASSDTKKAASDTKKSVPDTKKKASEPKKAASSAKFSTTNKKK